MVVNLTSEQESHLGQIAQQRGKNSEELILDTIFHLLEEDLEIQQVLDERILAADRGVFLDETQMDARVQAMLAKQ